MIVADSSALLAVVLAEDDAAVFKNALLGQQVGVSAATVTEARIAVSRRAGLPAVTDLNSLLSIVRAKVVPYDDDHATIAHAAYSRFGKGQHSAQLNFGDCMAYATAKIAGAPLLFKGEDFRQTDIASAL